jgi:hypothetical protein
MRTVPEAIDYRIAPERTNDVRAERLEWRGGLVEGPKGHPKKKDEDREVDYLVCLQCGTPCYGVFEMEGERIVEAMCLTCGNDETSLFNIGEEAGAEDE